MSRQGAAHARSGLYGGRARTVDEVSYPRVVLESIEPRDGHSQRSALTLVEPLSGTGASGARAPLATAGALAAPLEPPDPAADFAVARSRLGTGAHRLGAAHWA